MLRKRLESRGLTLPAVLAGVLVAQNSAALSAPAVAAVTHAALAAPAVGGMKVAILAATLLLATGAGAELAAWPDEKG